ncbi:MAG: sigma-70 family RNA polymerase sigma factor [Bryobacterales bacterium]|nr:sigma-70 family RNA polymerase sigma factor [Bryobacterales bacterium]
MLSGDITKKLQAWSNGDRSAYEEVLPLLLDDMRAIARRMAKPGSTLNTTALVNETYLRLARSASGVSSREHFLSLVARAMRQILIDHARTQNRLKRGGGSLKVTLTEDLELTQPRIALLLEIDQLLDRLEDDNPRRCRIFEMRFFAGLAVEEIAAFLGMSERTVVRDYRLACAWLRFHFETPPPNQGAAT